MYTVDRMKNSILIFLITIGWLLLFVLVIDSSAFYLFDVKPPGYKSERFFEFHPVTGNFHKPSAEGYWYRYRDGTKFYVKINAFGFADSERQIKASKPRIALIGDSTAQFWEAPNSQRAHHLIESQLNSRYEVLNLGVRGYGTDQTFLLFKDVGIQFQPDIVILNFCINDFWDNLRRDSKPYYVMDDTKPYGLELAGYPLKEKKQIKKPFFKNFVWTYSFLARRLGLIRHPMLKPYYPLDEHFELRPYKKSYNQQDELMVDLTQKILIMFRDLLSKNGIKLLVVEGLYKPAVDTEQQQRYIQLYGDQFDFQKVTTILEQFCKTNGIEFISLPQEIIRNRIDAQSFIHAEDTMHLNAIGARYYTELVVDKLRSLKWIQ